MSKRPREEGAAAQEESSLLFCVWNINGVRAKFEGTWFKKWLPATIADIFFAQELRISDSAAAKAKGPPAADTVRSLLGSLSPPYQLPARAGALELGTRGHNGVGAFVRSDGAAAGVVLAARAGLPGYAPPDGADPGRLVALLLGAPYHVVALNVYTPNSGGSVMAGGAGGQSLKQPRREAWDAAFLRLAQELLSDGGAAHFGKGGGCGGGGGAVDFSRTVGRLLVMGDMNVLPTAKDVESKVTIAGMNPFERANFARLLAQTGLVDVWRKANPDGGKAGFTFVDDRCAGRFDYVLASPAVEPQLGRMEVYDWRAKGDASFPRGDHLPFFIALRGCGGEAGGGGGGGGGGAAAAAAAAAPQAPAEEVPLAAAAGAADDV